MTLIILKGDEINQSSIVSICGWSLLTWYKNNKMEFEEENQFQFQMPQKNSVIF